MEVPGSGENSRYWEWQVISQEGEGCGTKTLGREMEPPDKGQWQTNVTAKVQYVPVIKVPPLIMSTCFRRGKILRNAMIRRKAGQ